MAVEYQKLVAVFETDTSRATPRVVALDTATDKYDKTVQRAGKNLTKFSSESDRMARSGQSAQKRVSDLNQSTQQFERSAEKTGRTVRTMASDLSRAESAANNLGGSLRRGISFGGGGGSGGFLPGLANISSIIRGIPQIGQLAGAIIQPLTDAAEEGIRLNMVLEQAEIGFSQVAGSAGKAREHLKNLLTFGAQSPFRFEGLLNASRLMTAMGFSIDEQIPKLKIWGSAIASSGELSEESVHRVVLAFGQMRMAGRVNAQDMMQLTNANIPGWQLLAKAIGRTVAETRKMAEAGKLNGKVAVEAITAMMATDQRYKGMMERLQGTLGGRLSAAQDVLQLAQGTATEGLSKNLSKMLEDALGRQDLVGKLAATINTAITPASALIETALETVLSGSISSGISKGMSAAKDAVKAVMMDFASESILGSVKSALGINSPSTEFIALGINSARSYGDGFSLEMASVSDEIRGSFDAMLADLDGALNASKGRRFVNPRAQSKSNLDKLTAREPDFLPKLIAGARARGIDPDHLLNVMAIETAGSFNPAITNPWGFTGLIQFGRGAAKDLGTSTGALRQMSGTQQLDYVFRYLDQHLANLIGKGPISQAQLYSAVGAGRAARDDQAVMFRGGSKAYALNAGSWDVNKDRMIQQWEFGVAALSRMRAGIDFTVNGSPVTVGNPVPVAITYAGSMLNPAAVVRDIIGGSSSELAPPEAGVFADPNRPDIMMPKSAELLSTSLLNIAGGPELHSLPTLLGVSADQAKRLDENLEGVTQQLGAGEWFKAITSMGGVVEKLGQLRDTMPTIGQMMETTFISIPERFGDIFGDAVSRSDGTIRGFLSSVRQNILSTFQQIAADIVRQSVARAGMSILQGLVGRQEMDPTTGEATGKVVGGSSFFRRILGWFGIKTGGAAGQDVTTASNTTATQANTIAITQNTAALTGGGIASAATGGGKGGGLLGTVLNIALGGLLGGIHFGGSAGRAATAMGQGAVSGVGAGVVGSGATSVVHPYVHRAFGGPVRAGQTVMVGDDPFGRPNPEMFTPNQDGFITPAGARSGSLHLHLTQVIHAPQGRVAPESAEQAATKSINALKRYDQQRASANNF